MVMMIREEAVLNQERNSDTSRTRKSGSSKDRGCTQNDELDLDVTVHAATLCLRPIISAGKKSVQFS